MSENLRMNPACVLRLIVMLSFGLWVCSTNVYAQAGSIKDELGVKRVNTFAFARKPSIKNLNGKIKISFATTAACDASVAIQDAQGRIVRHLASGVLGDHAPEPFQKGSLEQTLVWDGKDDFGEFVEDLSDYSVRVSLGLRAEYEKALYYNPYRNIAKYNLVRTGPDGVYVFSQNFHGINLYLRKFSHTGEYIETLHPTPANKVGQVTEFDWMNAPPDSKKIPVKCFGSHGALLPIKVELYDTWPGVFDLSVCGKSIALMGMQGIVRLMDDGRADPAGLKGAPNDISIGERKKAGTTRPFRVARSPDGKWLYYARVVGALKNSPDIQYRANHLVYRQPYEGVALPKEFLNGNEDNSGKGFNYPTGIAVDRKGRVYVADWQNDRLVVFSDKAEFIKSIQVKAPMDVVVHQKTDQIYVFSGQLFTQYVINKNPKTLAFNKRGLPSTVRKFGPVEKPELLLEAPLPYDGSSLADVDSWAEKPTIWVSKGGSVRMYVEENGKLKLEKDFEKEAESKGFRNYSPPYQRWYMYYDPQKENLYVAEMDSNEVKYFKKLWRISVNTGEQKMISLPVECADAAIDAQGFMYLMNNSYVMRYRLDGWKEAPFDYGEEAKGGISVIRNTGGHTSSYKHFSLGVSPKGEVIVSGMGSLGSADRRSNGKSSNGGNTWAPTLYPGRPKSGVLIHIFDQHGEVKRMDILQGIGLATGGVGLDEHGHVYAAIRELRLYGDKSHPSSDGTLAKFPLAKGRFLASRDAVVPLDNKPSRSPEVSGKWVEGAEWLYGGTPVGSLGHCFCRQGRFILDYYGRAMVPEPWRYDVAILDSAGNVIMRVGQYGNVDSAGPDSRVPLGGDEIGLFDAHYVATHTDKRLFIADVGNGRIVSAKLSYHQTELVSLKEAAKN